MGSLEVNLDHLLSLIFTKNMQSLAFDTLVLYKGRQSAISEAVLFVNDIKTNSCHYLS